jgi:peptide/nickel transport system permease protein
MWVYIVRRLAQAAATLFLLSILFFLLSRLNPSTPCFTLGCTENLHLDEPLSNQYLTWIGQLLHGDFGTSTFGQSVGTVILEHLPPTVVLVGVSLIIQQLIALPLGIFAALRPYSARDQLLTFGSYVALSLPAFVLGFVLIYIFAVQLGLLPTAHYEDPSVPLLWTPAWFSALLSNPGYVLGDLTRHLILPVFTLTVTGIAIDSRFMRAAMLQVLHQEYIRTAKAKGLKRRSIIFKHALRNALLPIITNLGLYLPALIGGVVVVETVFTWGGLGYTFSQSIGGYYGGDLPTMEALVMLSALAVVLANLLADLAYAWLDPRIRYEGGNAD